MDSLSPRFPFCSWQSGSSPAPPPQLEDLVEVCGGEAVKDWEGLGKALNVPETKLEDFSLTHKQDAEKCKEQLFKVFSPITRAKQKWSISDFLFFYLGLAEGI